MLSILDIPEVNKESIQKLMNDECAIIWCRGFVPSSEAKIISNQILDRCEVTPYRNIDKEVGRIGQSFFETLNDDGTTNQKALNIYMDNVLNKKEEIEKACSPYQVPLNRIYSIMNDLFGATLASIDKKEMFTGAVRIIPTGKDVVPHNDSFSRDAPDLPLAAEIDAQFSANIYLSLPDTGGELEIWDTRPSDEELAAIPASGSGYGHHRKYFPEPDLVLRPGAGDLLFFRTDVIHAVKRVGEGTRMNMNCFFAKKKDNSLIYWS